MPTYLDKILAVIDSLPNFLVYVILTLSSFLENVFPPAPGDMIIAIGAFLVNTYRLNFISVYISTTMGSVVGFMLLIWIGTFLDRHFFIKKITDFLMPKILSGQKIGFDVRAIFSY